MATNPETNSVPQVIHTEHCWSYGPQHYECAMQRIARQHEQLYMVQEAARSALLAIRGGQSFDHLDNVIAPILADALKTP